jgi:hypothetical protein
MIHQHLQQLTVGDVYGGSFALLGTFSVVALICAVLHAKR